MRIINDLMSGSYDLKMILGRDMAINMMVMRISSMYV